MCLYMALLVLPGCDGCREEAARTQVAMGGRSAASNQPANSPMTAFHGLDLSTAPRTTHPDTLTDLFEERPAGSESHVMRDEVERLYQTLDGTVYYVPAKQCFYVQRDPIGSSTMTFYGPFPGDLLNTLGLGRRPDSDDAAAPGITPPAASVDPLYELDGLIQAYHRQQDTPQAEAALATMRQQWSQDRASGGALWGSKDWMKSPEYYQSLDTEALTLECFSRAIFAFETTIFNDPRIGVERLRAYHDGFAELFGRDDLWRGVLCLYTDLTDRITLDADMGQIVRTSGHFNALYTLYLYTPLRDQIKGREPLFLQANLEAVRKYVWYLDNYDREQGRPGFFREPVQVLQMAMLLTAETDPDKYAAARAELSKVLWTQDQEPEKLRSFLALGVELLE